MNKITVLLMIIGIVISIFLPTADAALKEWHNIPKTGTNPDEIFELRFEIEADETANYSITIDPGTKFSAVDGNTTLTLNIPKDETRTFIFNMQIDEQLEDGKHVIYYNASKEDVVFKSSQNLHCLFTSLDNLSHGVKIFAVEIFTMCKWK